MASHLAPTGSLALGDSLSSILATAAALLDKPKRDRPLCPHCGLQEQAIDKCYKFHGYPLSYKAKSKSTQVKAQVHQTASSVSESTIV